MDGNKVVIAIEGGEATILECPKNIVVEVINYDNDTRIELKL